MLKKCLTTLKSSDGIEVTTIVVESNKKLKDKQSTLDLPIDYFIVPDDEKFNYNKFQNYGLDYSKNDIVCFSNNDVFYEKNTTHFNFWIFAEL